MSKLQIKKVEKMNGQILGDMLILMVVFLAALMAYRTFFPKKEKKK